MPGFLLGSYKLRNQYRFLFFHFLLGLDTLLVLIMLLQLQIQRQEVHLFHLEYRRKTQQKSVIGLLYRLDI